MTGRTSSPARAAARPEAAAPDAHRRHPALRLPLLWRPHTSDGIVTGQVRVLLGLLLFNGVSAAFGGLALMTELIPERESWTRNTDFSSNYFPGVILMAVVGGSSLIAAAALAKRSEGWHLASIVAGTIMVLWIVGEIASIRGFHFLQVVYAVTGGLVVMWTPTNVRATLDRRGGGDP